MRNPNANSLDLEDYDIPEIASLFEIATGSTYRNNELERRLNLLSAEERKDVLGAINDALSLIADAENIIDCREAADEEPLF